MVLAVGLLAGCGGGDSPAPASSTISGTAATGAAISGGTVTLKCTAGTASTVTTDVNGNFSVSPSGITFPCVGRVDYKDSSGISQKLHTFISKSGVANITPISELIVASLTGTSPANAFDNFDTAVKPKNFTATQVTAAVVAVKAYLKGQGLAVDDIPSDPLGTAMVATSSGTPGDKFDKVLDALGVLLTKNKQKLSDLVATFITSTSASPALAGYPATAVYVGKLSDGSACSITVAADHSITASAASWAYTGASIKANLDGTYYQGTGADVGFGLFYNGKSNFYGATAGDYAAASKSAPAFQVGLNLDATSGKFISAYGTAITDSSYFVAGANFDFTCAGEAYPAGGAIPPSEFNKAPASEFKATSFIGTFNAPDFSGQPPVLTACTIAVDSVGNTTLTSPNFTGGSLVARYTSLYTSTGSVNDVNNATYELKLGPDRFTIFLRNNAGVRSAQVTINGLGSGVSSKGEKALTCSTANDPGPGLVAYLAKAGTYKGVLSRGNNFSGNTNSPVCNVTISAAGVTTYTDSLGGVKSVTSNAANPPTITVDATYGTNYDLQPDGNFAVTFDTPPTLRDSSTNQLLGDRLFYAKPGASESCLQLKKQ